MIYELGAESYDRVKPLYEPLAFLPFCAGVLKESHGGRIFVDNLEQPRTAFMLAWGCWAYLGGDPNNADFIHALNKALFAKEILDENAWGLFLSCPPDGWTEQLAAVCAPRQPIEFPRRHYVAHKLSYDWRANVPKDFAIRRMDKSPLDLPGADLPGDIKEMIDVIDWDVDVIEKGCGFVATYDGDGQGSPFAAHAMIDCVVGDVGEIGLFTQEAYRRRGLAHGLSTVVWDCHAYNPGSVRTAEKLGLEHERDHMMYVIHFDEPGHWGIMAWTHADRGSYQKTLEICERLFSRHQDPPEVAFLAAARAWAAFDNREKAFFCLNQALDRGWAYAPDLENAEFDGLRDTPAWKTILERIQVT